MKTKHIIAVILITFTGLGCTNLDEKLYSTMYKDLIYESEQMLMAYSGVAYTKLQAYGSEQSLWTLNIQFGDELAAPRNAYNDWIDPRYKELQTHSMTSSNKLARMGWDFCFDGIASCNDVIYEIGRATVEFSGKQKLLSEIKVLRAFFYFCAIDGWGNVPYSFDASDKSYPPQKDRAFIFPIIEREILDNIQHLDETPSSYNYGRITQGVAYTILAKMYLNAKEWIGTDMWKEAEEACLNVMDAGHYKIADSYKSNFAVNNEGSVENIFVIPYSTTYTTSDHNDFVVFIMSLAPAQSKSFNIPTTCWDGFICQPDFFTTYDNADTRRSDSWLYGQQYELGGAKLTVDGVDFIINPIVDANVYSTGKGVMDGAKVGKWEYQTDGRLTSDQVSMDNDFALFRYADVLYMYAEALLCQGKDVAAATNRPDFQKIRTRAGLMPFTVAELSLDGLLLERGHELSLEGWRRQDLIRFGKWNQTWWAKPLVSPSYAKLYPIPRERRGDNPNLVQNPGYTN